MLKSVFCSLEILQKYRITRNIPKNTNFFNILVSYQFPLSKQMWAKKFCSHCLCPKVSHYCLFYPVWPGVGSFLCARWWHIHTRTHMHTQGILEFGCAVFTPFALWTALGARTADGRGDNGPREGCITLARPRTPTDSPLPSLRFFLVKKNQGWNLCHFFSS